MIIRDTHRYTSVQRTVNESRPTYNQEMPYNLVYLQVKNRVFYP